MRTMNNTLANSTGKQLMAICKILLTQMKGLLILNFSSALTPVSIDSNHINL